ncbi:MAG: uracil-DNA glycosylase family protein, partial [Salinarchaeum sp.]
MSDDELVVSACERCPELVASRSQIVNGTGAEDAAMMLIGEAPGAREDEQGTPFVGRSGDTLTAALKDRGLLRSAVRITNCVRCHPPENRDPTTTELSNCREYLVAEIEGVDPDVILTLGKVPSEHLLGRDVTVTSEAGTVVETTINGTTRTVVIGIHPAATLYDRSQQSTFERALDR